MFPGVGKKSIALLVAVLPICHPGFAAAQSAASTPAGGWLDQDTMTGDWGGLRTRLKKDGIDLRAHYVTESAFNPVGGKSEGAAYTQQIDFGADLDLGRLADIPGGKIQVILTDRAGRSLAADHVGSLFSEQELFGAGQNFRLAELNYQQSLLDGRIAFQLGWSPMGDGFATTPLYCYFQSGALCGHPTSLPNDSGGWHDFPTAQWGGRIKVAPTPEYYAQTGVYQVNPDEGDSNAGFDLRFDGTGVIVPVELGWLPGHGRGGLPGEYKIGGYYDSSTAPDLLTDVNGFSAGLTGAPFAQHNGRWGFYATATQMVYRERSDPKRGLTLFGLGTVSDPETAKFRYFLAGGGAYQGTFPGRDDDFVSLLVASVGINDRLTEFQEDRNTLAPRSVGVQTYESVIEVDYGAQIAPWLTLRPNLQYVIHPGGTGTIPDALILALYTRVTF